MTSLSALRSRVPLAVIPIVRTLMLIGDYWREVLDGQHIDVARAAHTPKSKAVAVRVATLPKRGDARRGEDLIESLAKEDFEIRSIGVRRASGDLFAQTAAHAERWRPVFRDRSDVNHVRVPIYGGKEL